MLEGEQGVVVLSRDQGGAAAALLSDVLFRNTSVVVGVFGNATRPGVHDLRPVGADSPEPSSEPQANCTGFWFEHANAASVNGGGVAFLGPAQPWWQPGATCWAASADSSVRVEGLSCTPAVAA